MTLPAIGAIGGVLSQSALAGLRPGETAGIGAGASAAPGASTGLSLSTAPAGVEQAAGAGAVGGVSEAGSLTGAGGSPTAAGLEGSAGSESGGFGAALTQAISSLDQSQQSADGAAQALATGTASNPESAVVTVQDAQLEMQLASQIRTKATEAAQQIFQTQV